MVKSTFEWRDSSGCETKETVSSVDEAQGVLKGMFGLAQGALDSIAQFDFTVRSTDQAILDKVLSMLNKKKESNHWTYYHHIGSNAAIGAAVGTATGASIALASIATISKLGLITASAATPPGWVILGLVGGFVLIGCLIGWAVGHSSGRYMHVEVKTLPEGGLNLKGTAISQAAPQ